MDLIGAAFDEMQVDALGNHLFIKRCGRQDAPKILIDTHLDEIGMMVNGYRDDGFLRLPTGRRGYPHIARWRGSHLRQGDAVWRGCRRAGTSAPGGGCREAQTHYRDGD